PPRKKQKEGVMRLQADCDNSGVIRFELDQISTLNHNVRFSPVVEVGGVPWRVRVRKNQETQNFTLLVQLESIAAPKNPFTFDVEAQFILIHSDESKSFSVTRKKTFHRYQQTMNGFCRCWIKIMQEKEGFIKEDKIIVETRFTISGKTSIRDSSVLDFSDPSEPSNDVALVIDGEKIYVNKGILAVYSPVLKTMFFGDFAEKNKMEIEMKDIVREEFVELLHVIYPSCKKITNDSMKYLLKLGDRFDIAYVLDRVEDFLIYWAEMEKKEKLELADQYKLIRLKQFINDSAITAVTRIESQPRFDFTDPSELSHDLALVIDGQKIYVNKGILAVHSPVFDTMFFGAFSEKDKEEIELKDIVREEFIDFLHVIYPSCKTITNDSAEYLLDLGDRFMIANVMNRVEDFLIFPSIMANKRKLRLANHYRLFKLQ
ncbi:hypothetical protein PENTCL1PPCAC_25211, partial [Pristionchus entomophagus]